MTVAKKMLAAVLFAVAPRAASQCSCETVTMTTTTITSAQCTADQRAEAIDSGLAGYSIPSPSYCPTPTSAPTDMPTPEPTPPTAAPTPSPTTETMTTMSSTTCTCTSVTATETTVTPPRTSVTTTTMTTTTKTTTTADPSTTATTITATATTITTMPAVKVCATEAFTDTNKHTNVVTGHLHFGGAQKLSVMQDSVAKKFIVKLADFCKQEIAGWEKEVTKSGDKSCCSAEDYHLDLVDEELPDGAYYFVIFVKDQSDYVYPKGVTVAINDDSSDGLAPPKDAAADAHAAGFAAWATGAAVVAFFA